MRIDQIIDSAVRQLNEKEKKEREGRITARPGRGRVKSYIRKSKSRAESEPEGLMKDLGVTDSFIGTIEREDFENQVVAVIRKSITYNAAMSEAFVGIRYRDGSDHATIAMGKLDSRDGVMFMNHILKAAQDAKFLRLDKDIDVNKSGKSAVEINFIPTA